MALAVHGGPLPERTVRALGAALAETLTGAHAIGITHAGLPPASVLLAWVRSLPDSAGATVRRMLLHRIDDGDATVTHGRGLAEGTWRGVRARSRLPPRRQPP
ncbi:hypothetical protein [Streptomyces sp. NPDC000880]